MQEGFIFGPGTGKTYADMTRAREIAKALTDGMPQAPRNVGEGLNAIGSALLARAQTKRADKMRDDLAGQITPDHPLFAKLYGLPAYRNGTNFHPGGMAVVGEDGPEVVQLPRGAAVIPNPMTMAYRPGVDQANVYQGPATAGMAQVMQAQADPDPTAKGNMFFVDPEGTVPPQLLERFKQLPMDMQRSIVDEIMKGAPAQELIPPERKSGIAPDPAAVMASINPQPVKPQSRMMDAQAVQVADASGQPTFAERANEANLDLNVTQAQRMGQALRLLQAEADLRKLEETQGIRKGQRLLEILPDGIENLLIDDEYGQFKTARDAFAEAAMRADTGATINESEWPRILNTLMVKPGDSPERIAQRRAMRETIIQGLMAASGADAAKIMPQIGEPVVPAPDLNPAELSDEELLKMLGGGN